MGSRWGDTPLCPGCDVDQSEETQDEVSKGDYAQLSSLVAGIIALAPFVFPIATADALTIEVASYRLIDLPNSSALALLDINTELLSLGVLIVLVGAIALVGGGLSSHHYLISYGTWTMIWGVLVLGYALFSLYGGDIPGVSVNIRLGTYALIGSIIAGFIGMGYLNEMQDK